MATRLQRLRRDGYGETFPFAGPAFRRAAPWLMAGVALAGLLTRLHPAIRFAVWGSDSGEYILLTRQLVESGRILFDYDGWGLAYPYFPGMYVVSGAVHAVIGIDVMHATLWTLPVVAATIPVLVGLLGYRVTGDPRVGILAGAFVAVTSPVVLITSHAMPGTLGHVLLLGLLVFLPDAYRDRRHLPLLMLILGALLVTHHLTTYFAVGIVAFVAFYRELTQRASDVPRLRVEIPLVALGLAGALAWWLGVAKPFREEIVGDAFDLDPWLTAILFLLALAALPGLVWFKRQRTEWHKAPRYPRFPTQRAWVLGTTALWIAILVAIVLVRLPGSEIDIGWVSLAYALPVLVFLGFVPLGIAVARFQKHGTLLLGWLYAILGSLAFAVVTESKVLFPFRHADYMVEAMAPLLAIGILIVYDQTLAAKVPAERPRVRSQFVAALAFFLLLSAATSLPPRETLGGFEEAIYDEELDAVLWARDHPEVIPPASTIAADHRVSSLLWGLAGLHPTWDYTPRTYHGEFVDEALSELRSAHVPPRGDQVRVDHVLLSPAIERGVTLVQWETSEPMSPKAIAKFDDPHFEKLYDAGGVRIYRVLWEPVKASP